MAFVEVVKPLFGKPKETEVAKSPDEWFSYIKKRGARGIHLVHNAQKDPQISDRMSAGFVGGGEAWSMEVFLSKEESEFWMARWEVWNQNATDRRIWRVTYGRVAEAKSKPFKNQSLQAIEDGLLKVLHDAYAFSKKHNCGGFTDSFSKGIQSLTGSERHGYHKDLAPSGLLEAKASAILDASQSAWVFGGMGSWNDMGFDGEAGKEYARISERLFQTLTESICVAANSTLRKIELGAATNGRGGHR